MNERESYEAAREARASATQPRAGSGRAAEEALRRMLAVAYYRYRRVHHTRADKTDHTQTG